MKSDFKQMRRQRDEFIDKFDALKEKFDDLRRKSCITPKTLFVDRQKLVSIRFDTSFFRHDDDVRRFRRNHAAKVIQRQWRTYRENPRSTNNKSNVSRVDSIVSL